jgi:formamidopyrimidine-DNA glycosylase
MPELPSVEIYKQYFDKTSLNQTISSFEVKSPEILVNTTPQKLQKALIGQEFISSRRYGKYLFSHLNNDYFLVMHFGMTGYLYYSRENNSKHPRLLIVFSNGNHLAFDDARKFGKLGLTRDPQKFIREKALGPDALEVDLNSFKESFRRRKGMIKPLLLNQKLIAGIGNLYADEILYQSRLHPQTHAHHLNPRDWEQLFQNMKMVLKKAIEYQDKPGALPSSFLLPHRYQGGECPDGRDLEIVKVGGRTTYLCPHLQIRK